MTSLFDWAACQPQSSPPRVPASHNPGERDPSVMPGSGGGEANEWDGVCACENPLAEKAVLTSLDGIIDGGTLKCCRTAGA